MVKKRTAVSLCLFFASTVYSEKLFLKSGEVLNVEIKKETDTSYIIQQGSSWQEIDKQDIVFVEKNEEKENVNKLSIEQDLIVKFGIGLSNKNYTVDGNEYASNKTYDINTSYSFIADYSIKAYKQLFLVSV